ncbi:MAG: LysR family transcriptional regulator [Acidobacteria bacterium]|nr:LysR family transcriptional regulator [Acidobacteriota bacterium]
MELKQSRSLVALSELGSISLVAEQLHLTPAAVHKQLKILEEELGVRLYEMIGRHLKLTQAAEIVLPYLKDLLAQSDSAISALEEWKGMKRGLVRIGAGPTISSYILPVLLKKFRNVHPGIELIVESGNTPVLLESLGKGSIDLALLVSCDLLEEHEFSVEAYWDFELVLVSHLKHPPRRPCLADLRGFRFILFRKGSRMQEPIDRYFAAYGFVPKVIMRFDNAEAISAMIRTGLGISMLPMWIVDKDLKQRRLSLIRQEEPPLISKIALISRRSSYAPRAVQAFIAEARNVAWKNPRLVTPPAPNR